MSATNWATCPTCIGNSKRYKEIFIKKYTKIIDPFVMKKIVDAIDAGIEHLESYSTDEYKADKDILELMEERKYELEPEEIKSKEWGADAGDLLNNGVISCNVREDYQSYLLDEEAVVMMSYEAKCDRCGLYKQFDFDERKHKIVEKK